MVRSGYIAKVVSLVSIFLCLLLSGCVTDNSGGGTGKKLDKKKQLELHNQMAAGYVDRGNRESARFHLDKAFELDSDNAMATNTKALLYVLEGEPKLAEEQFRLAIKRDKHLTLAYNNFGVFLYGQKRYEEALTMFERASEDLAYKDRAYALTNTGKTALKLGNEQKAEAAFRHAVILDKKNSEAYIELSEIALARKEYADAKAALDAFTQLTEHTARSLMIAIRLDKIFGNREKEASFALILKSKFPYSKEYLDYKQGNF